MLKKHADGWMIGSDSENNVYFNDQFNSDHCGSRYTTIFKSAVMFNLRLPPVPRWPSLPLCWMVKNPHQCLGVLESGRIEIVRKGGEVIYGLLHW